MYRAQSLNVSGMGARVFTRLGDHTDIPKLIYSHGWNFRKSQTQTRPGLQLK